MFEANEGESLRGHSHCPTPHTKEHSSCNLASHPIPCTQELRADLETASTEMTEAEAAFAELRSSFAEVCELLSGAEHSLHVTSAHTSANPFSQACACCLLVHMHHFIYLSHRCSFAHILLQDPLSLVPWMQTLFALADAGMTTFDVSGRFFPYTNLRALFNSDNSSSMFDGCESVLGTFKRRCVVEVGCTLAVTAVLCAKEMAAARRCIMTIRHFLPSLLALTDIQPHTPSQV